LNTIHEANFSTYFIQWVARRPRYSVVGPGPERFGNLCIKSTADVTQRNHAITFRYQFHSCVSTGPSLVLLAFPVNSNLMDVKSHDGLKELSYQ